jgi:hypothetical protein
MATVTLVHLPPPFAITLLLLHEMWRWQNLTQKNEKKFNPKQPRYLFLQQV